MLSVSEVAKRFEVTPHTVRNWDRRGLIKANQVTPSGRKFYSEEQINKFKIERKDEENV